MVEYDHTQEREYAQQVRLKICVAGVGGAGLHVVEKVAVDRMMDAHLIAFHTDIRVLDHSMAGTRVQLGADWLRGIGAGGDPDLGREAASLSRECIKAALQGHHIVFICCGLGGGTASGAAPVIVQVAKEAGAKVLVFATIPFGFEGRRRIGQAQKALDELQNLADAMIVFENNRMGELVLPKEGVLKAFAMADQLIGHSVQAIASMVSRPGFVRVSLTEFMSALGGPSSRCLFGFGEAQGVNRVPEVLERALQSPLLHRGLLLQNARNLLVHVAGNENLTVGEVELLMKELSRHVPADTRILLGLAVDPKLGDTLALTLVSSLAAHELALAPAEIHVNGIHSQAVRQTVADGAPS